MSRLRLKVPEGAQGVGIGKGRWLLPRTRGHLSIKTITPVKLKMDCSGTSQFKELWVRKGEGGGPPGEVERVCQATGVERGRKSGSLLASLVWKVSLPDRSTHFQGPSSSELHEETSTLRKDSKSNRHGPMIQPGVKLEVPLSSRVLQCGLMQE